MADRSYLRYGPHPEQEADLEVPAGEDPAVPRDVVVLVHGGFWRERWRRDLMAPLAADLAEHGIASLNVEYRRLDCGGGWPGTLHDVEAAVDHLAALGHRPAVAVGHSAGGHLALLLAGRVRAVVGQAAVSDLEEGSRLRLGDGVVDRFAPTPQDRRDGSPAARAPLPVPVLLVHGTGDEDVPASMSEAFAARGGSVDLRLRPGEGHFEHVDPASGAWEEARTWLRARL
jgi:acetyl esterase/lipase